MTDFQTSDRDVNRAIRSWLHEDRHEDASRIAGAVLDHVEATPERRAGWPAWRRPSMNRIVTFGLGAAAVVVIGLLLGYQLLGSPDSLGGPRVEPTASSEPSAPDSVASPSAVATPGSATDGDLAAGTYVAHPLPVPNDSLAVTFTVPEGWSYTGGSLVPTSDDPGTGAPGGVAIQFTDVTTLNGDPCQWSGTDDDVSVGPEVDDLVDSLLAQTAYEVSDAVDVTIGGYSGKRVDIVHPTEPFDRSSAFARQCHSERYFIWSTTVHGPQGIYAQGPANRWQANILDVEGTRFVIVVQDFPGTSPADRAELDGIVDSLIIKP